MASKPEPPFPPQPPGLESNMQPAPYFASNADSAYVTGHVLPQLGGGTTAG